MRVAWHVAARGITCALPHGCATPHGGRSLRLATQHKIRMYFNQIGPAIWHPVVDHLGLLLACPPGMIECNGVCIDPSNDPNNCGACGVICQDPTPTCVDGVCQGGDIPCNSCRDCNNQACVNGVCGSCTTHGQCCAPLICVNGTCSILN